MKARFCTDQDGIAMIEATIGTVLLLTAALIAMQLVLIFHGALAAHSAATRAARAMAITGQDSSAQRVYQQQRATSLGAVQWDPRAVCSMESSGATCRVRVRVPTLVPGVGLLLPDGLEEEGWYPNFQQAN